MRGTLSDVARAAAERDDGYPPDTDKLSAFLCVALESLAKTRSFGRSRCAGVDGCTARACRQSPSTRRMHAVAAAHFSLLGGPDATVGERVVRLATGGGLLHVKRRTWRSPRRIATGWPRIEQQSPSTRPVICEPSASRISPTGSWRSTTTTTTTPKPIGTTSPARLGTWFRPLVDRRLEGLAPARPVLALSRRPPASREPHRSLVTSAATATAIHISPSCRKVRRRAALCRYRKRLHTSVVHGGARSADHRVGCAHADRLEVATAVADGLTNQQVAERLFMSLPTVKTHLRHIFDKLASATVPNSLPLLPIEGAEHRRIILLVVGSHPIDRCRGCPPDHRGGMSNNSIFAVDPSFRAVLFDLSARPSTRAISVTDLPPSPPRWPAGGTSIRERHMLFHAGVSGCLDQVLLATVLLDERCRL